MNDELITDFVEALLEDSERLGRLDRAHIVQVASRRAISLPQLDRAFEVLREQGVVAEEVTGKQRAASGVIDVESPAAVVGKSVAPSSQIGRHPILSAEEEVRLGRRIQMGLLAAQSLEAGEELRDAAALVHDGDVARNVLVRHNVRLAIDIARHFLPSAGDLELDDLIQEGALGLNRAAEKFDPTLGYKFSTYASWWVRESVGRAIANKGSLVRLPVHVRDDLRRVNRYARGFEERNGREPSLLELAEALGESPAEIRALLDWSAPVIHLDVPVDEEGRATLGDLMLVSKVDPPEEEAVQHLLWQQILDTIRTMLMGMDPRLFRLLEGRFGLDGEQPMTLDALGREFGCTRERVRQLEKKLLERLRANDGLKALMAEYWGWKVAA